MDNLEALDAALNQFEAIDDSINAAKERMKRESELKGVSLEKR